MPYHNHWTDNGLYRKFTGTLRGIEIFESNTELHGDERFDDLKYIINDFSAIVDYDFSDIDINLIANSDKVSKLIYRNIKIALIINNPALHEWVEKYYLKLGETMFDMRLFDTLEEAETWIRG